MEREKSYEGSSAKKDAVCRHSAAHRTAVRVRPFRPRLVPGSSRLYSGSLGGEADHRDVATPIADKLADLSSHFLLVLCAVFLEKYLLTITGTVTFSFLIPVSCLLYVLYVLFDWKSLRLLAARLTAFGLLIFLVIPASVYVSDLIEDSYQASIEATIETARDAAAELESESETAGEGEKGFFSGLISTVTDGVSGITDKVGEMVNRFMEALAVMLVTCCAIPVLVLLSFLWFAKILLSVELPVSYSGIHHGLKDRLFRKKRGEPQ